MLTDRKNALFELLLQLKKWNSFVYPVKSYNTSSFHCLCVVQWGWPPKNRSLIQETKNRQKTTFIFSVPTPNKSTQDGVPGYHKHSQHHGKRKCMFQKSQYLWQAWSGTSRSGWSHRHQCFLPQRFHHTTPMRPSELWEQQHESKLCSGLDISKWTLQRRSQLHSWCQFPLRPRCPGSASPRCHHSSDILGDTGIEGKIKWRSHHT